MITAQEIKDAVKRLRDLRESLAKLEEQAKPLNEEKDALQAKLTLMLREINEKSFKCEFGTVTRVTKHTVTLPDGENKQAFFNYLKERGVFEEMATIHHSKLNSYFNEQREIAIESGDVDAALNFSLPGIGESKAFETIQLRK
jgi:hypothetical protein